PPASQNEVAECIPGPGRGVVLCRVLGRTQILGRQQREQARNVWCGHGCPKKVSSVIGEGGSAIGEGGHHWLQRRDVVAGCGDVDATCAAVRVCRQLVGIGGLGNADHVGEEVRCRVERLAVVARSAITSCCN